MNTSPNTTIPSCHGRRVGPPPDGSDPRPDALRGAARLRAGCARAVTSDARDVGVELRARAALELLERLRRSSWPRGTGGSTSSPRMRRTRAMIREASGIASPDEPVRVARAVPVLVARADDRRRRCGRPGDARRIRSPTTVCWRMNSHSRSSSGPGLWRISSGTAILPMSCSCAARQSSSSSSRRSPSRSPDLDGERGDARRGAPGGPARGRRAPRGGRPSSGRGRRAASASARRGARRRGSSAWLDVRRLVGQHHGAERARDVEPLAVLGERGARPVDERLGFGRDRRARRGRTRRRRGGTRRRPLPGRRELLPEPREQRVPGGMAEAVVVPLEPVEVEDHQQRLGRRWSSSSAPLEVGEELAAVAETR